jgi:hypothetical protein
MRFDLQSLTLSDCQNGQWSERTSDIQRAQVAVSDDCRLGYKINTNKGERYVYDDKLSGADNQKIPSLLWNPKIYHVIHISTPPDTTLIQMKFNKFLHEMQK